MSELAQESGHGDSHPGESDHGATPAVYYAVFLALLVLLAATVGAAYVEFGRWSLVVAMAIALTKAVLIVVYFMHVRWSSPLLRVFVVGGFLWLGLMLALTFGDYATRQRPLGDTEGWIPRAAPTASPVGDSPPARRESSPATPPPPR